LTGKTKGGKGSSPAKIPPHNTQPCITGVKEKKAKFLGEEDEKNTRKKRKRGRVVKGTCGSMSRGGGQERQVDVVVTIKTRDWWLGRARNKERLLGGKNHSIVPTHKVSARKGLPVNKKRCTFEQGGQEKQRGAATCCPKRFMWGGGGNQKTPTGNQNGKIVTGFCVENRGQSKGFGWQKAKRWPPLKNHFGVV